MLWFWIQRSCAHFISFLPTNLQGFEVISNNVLEIFFLYNWFWMYMWNICLLNNTWWRSIPIEHRGDWYSLVVKEVSLSKLGSTHGLGQWESAAAIICGVSNVEAPRRVLVGRGPYSRSVPARRGIKTCTQIAHDCKIGNVQDMTWWVIQSHMPLSFRTDSLGGLVFTLLWVVKGGFEHLLIYYYNSKNMFIFETLETTKSFSETSYNSII